jgi:threonine/homoserine/homoserine lactone efflux protein
MKELIGGGDLGLVDHFTKVGPVSTDNPVVEVVVATAAAALLLYAGYKILNDKDAAENVSTVFGTKADKAP